ncbi:MAG: 4-hydroxy-tetrahydrodipicolinate reductase [Clostridia bacterium]|nr:4-hydroxy-tetrahydrodipicolinate reductase [Clostridia bacterium]
MNAAIVGYGRMGKMIEEILVNSGSGVIGKVDFDYYKSLSDIPDAFDVVIDFSHPDNLENTLSFSQSTRIPCVIGTTNLTDDQKALMTECAKYAPILYSANYSLGVSVIKKAAKMLYDALGEDFDVEIIETHHNKKADAPSGTAKAILDAIDPENRIPCVYGREGAPGARGKEIGVHAVRGGTVAGEHKVMFFGEDEILEIRHEAISRRIFAKGACRAAEWLIGKENGLYTMEDVLWGE